MLLTVAASLCASGCASTPLTAAVKSRDLSRVKALIEGGADINKSDSLGPLSTPLGYAARYDAPEIASYLVSKGAYDQRHAAINYASYNNHVDVVQAMLAAGADMPDMGLINMRGESLVDRSGKRLVAQGPPAVAAPVFMPRTATAESHGNLDDDAYARMRAAASQPPEQKPVSSDVDSPVKRGADRPADFALVIGIEKYSKLPEARFAENDADAMKKHLLALGYPERNIITLKGGQATRGAIQGYVEEWLPKNSKPNSRIFVYFSGHGSPDTKTGDAYLVPWDGDAMFLKSTAYPLKSLYASLAKLKAKRVLVALDSCFSGAGGRSVLAEGARPLVTRVDEVAAPAGVTVLSAASGDEITATLKDQGHGAFTYYLLKAFNNGKLTAKAAYDELKPFVQDEAHRQNREQTPLLLGDDSPF